jgi:hypothetical protein
MHSIILNVKAYAALASGPRPIAASTYIPTMPAEARRQRLLGPAQWRALRNLRRLDMVLALEAQSPCSIAEMAESLGCKPASLYRHMRVLLQAGLAAEAGRRAAGRRWTTLYREGPCLRAAHFDAPTGRGLAEHGRLVACLARPAARQYQRAAAALRGQSQTAAQRQLSSMFERTWMDDRQVDAFKRLVLRMFRLVQQGRRTRRGTRFQVSLMASPAI